MSGTLNVARSFMVIGSITLTGGTGIGVRTPGDPIPDIDVTVEQHPGPRLQTHTDGSGTFVFSLPAGTYTLRIGSKATPSGAAILRNPSRPGTANGSILALPAAGAGGSYPYVIRLTDANVAIQKIGFAVAVVARQQDGRTAAPAAGGRDVEVTLTLGSPNARAGTMFILRGGVESRQ